MEKPININEAVQHIKRAGQNKVRAVPMPGQNAQDGMYQIEVLEGGGWVPIAEGMAQSTATDIIKQAANRVICG